jgi:F-type H+-transporting ATPase subunit epsilon
MADLTVDIVTPERLVYSGPATQVIAPGFNGQFGVLPGHTLFLSVMRAGTVTVDTPSGSKRFIVGRGFAEAGSERVVLLTDSCEEPGDVDKDAAKKAVSEAEAILEQATPGTQEWSNAQIKLEHANARLEA